MHFHFKAGPISLRIGRERSLSVLLVRHGQSQTNVDKGLHGTIADPEVALTETGKAQAKAAGRFLKDWLPGKSKKPVRMYRSDYRRAIQTSDIIAGEIGDSVRLSTRVDDRIRELEFGYSDMISGPEATQSFPHYEAYKNLWDGDAKYYRRRLGGESPADVGDRLRHFIGAMYRDHDKHGIDTFVVVNHGLTSRVLAKLLLKEDRQWYAAQDNPQNCAIRLIRGKTDLGYISAGG